MITVHRSLVVGKNGDARCAVSSSFVGGLTLKNLADTLTTLAFHLGENSTESPRDSDMMYAN
jgi:hypothetical protein